MNQATTHATWIKATPSNCPPIFADVKVIDHDRVVWDGCYISDSCLVRKPDDNVIRWSEVDMFTVLSSEGCLPEDEPTSSYRCYPLTDPTDGPKATIALYPQWAEGARPKLLVSGHPGEGSFVEFVADAETVTTLRAAAAAIEEQLRND